MKNSLFALLLLTSPSLSFAIESNIEGETLPIEKIPPHRTLLYKGPKREAKLVNVMDSPSPQALSKKVPLPKEMLEVQEGFSSFSAALDIFTQTVGDLMEEKYVGQNAYLADIALQGLNYPLGYLSEFVLSHSRWKPIRDEKETIIIYKDLLKVIHHEIGIPNLFAPFLAHPIGEYIHRYAADKRVIAAWTNIFSSLPVYHALKEQYKEGGENWEKAKKTYHMPLHIARAIAYKLLSLPLFCFPIPAGTGPEYPCQTAERRADEIFPPHFLEAYEAFTLAHRAVTETILGWGPSSYFKYING